MTETRRAVVSYSVSATTAQKIQAVVYGIEDCAKELLDLGLPLEEIREALEGAMSWVEWNDEA